MAGESRRQPDTNDEPSTASPLVKAPASEARYGFALIEGRAVSADEIASVERGMSTVLPAPRAGSRPTSSSPCKSASVAG
jgi:hypothetical protein